MSGMQTTTHVNGDSITFNSVQDCTPIFEHCKALHNEGLHGSGEFKHAASFPQVLVEKYCHDHNLLFSEFMHDKTHIKAMLSDPSLSGFRIYKGKV